MTITLISYVTKPCKHKVKQRICYSCENIGINNIRKEERLAFADWLEQLDSDIDTCDWLSVRDSIKAKIKELRSNPLPKQSVGGKRSEGK